MLDKRSRTHRSGKTPDRAEAERIAIAALTFLVSGGPERIGRFLALTGLGPETVRVASRDPRFLAGVLDHLAGDEALLVEFASAAGIDAAAVSPARDLLANPPG